MRWPPGASAVASVFRRRLTELEGSDIWFGQYADWPAPPQPNQAELEEVGVIEDLMLLFCIHYEGRAGSTVPFDRDKFFRICGQEKDK